MEKVSVKYTPNIEYKLPHEKLDVWHKAKTFAIHIYSATKSFPDFEKFGLRSQLTRAAVSIASNIAEGNSRRSAKEQAYFTQIAYGSLMECACQMDIACELGYIAAQDNATFKNQIYELANKLNALRNAQLSRAS
jgi:four helix bundle protein